MADRGSPYRSGWKRGSPGKREPEPPRGGAQAGQQRRAHVGRKVTTWGLAGPGLRPSLGPSLGPGLLADGAGSPPHPARCAPRGAGVCGRMPATALSPPGSRAAVKSVVPHYCFLTHGPGFLPASGAPERRLPPWKKAAHTCILHSWGPGCFLGIAGRNSGGQIWKKPAGGRQPDPGRGDPAKPANTGPGRLCPPPLGGAAKSGVSCPRASCRDGL